MSDPHNNHRRRQTTHRPLREEGLVGTLIVPAESGPHPAVLTLGGSGGGLHEDSARALAEEGFAALALAYFGTEKLPGELVEIPLEYFGKVLSWLEAQPEVDPGRIAVFGGSKGGELALILGATYPESLKAVVAYAASGVAWQGITHDWRALRAGPKSSWTIGGNPVPFVTYARPSLRESVGFAGFLFGRPVALRPIYERAIKNRAAVQRAQIAVERINGPVLLVSGTDDRMWPSRELSEIAAGRLTEHEHPHEHLVYEGAGHMIGVPGAGENPGATEGGRFAFGGSRETNLAASADSWSRVLDLLRQRLGSIV